MCWIFIFISIPVVEIPFHDRASYKNEAKNPNGKAKQNIVKKIFIYRELLWFRHSIFGPSVASLHQSKKDSQGYGD